MDSTPVGQNAAKRPRIDESAQKSPRRKDDVLEAPGVKAMRAEASRNMISASVVYNKGRGDLDQRPLVVGDIVTMAVHKVDRGPTDPPRLPGVVVEVTEHGFYRVGVKAGVIKSCFRPHSDDLFLVPNVTVQAYGLENVLQNW